MQKRTRLKLTVMLATALVAVLAVFRQAPIPQDNSYHSFADGRTGLGLPNWQNVLSNLPFVLVGILGILSWWGRFKAKIGAPERAGWFCLFLGVTLTGFGSAYYHWAPANATLVWDRLPMTIGFTALFAAIIGERISHHAYRYLLWPLLGVGISSVIFWYASEVSGQGDLRLYILVQFFPLLTIPMIMALYEPRYSHGRYVIYALICYGIAKACEHFDRQVFELSAQMVSGHPLKHLWAAWGCWFLVEMYRKRQPLTAPRKTLPS